MTNKKIARELAITDRTVKMHLSTIYPLVGVHTRTQAAAVARSLPIREADDPSAERPDRPTDATAGSKRNSQPETLPPLPRLA